VNHAVAIDRLEIEAYASLDLLLVRPDPVRLRADFLATYLNLPSSQSALAGGRTRAVLPRLSLHALAELPIPLPSIERQGAVAGLALTARRERAILENLMAGRQRLLDEILRRAAEDEPMPTWYSAWAFEHLDHSASALEQSERLSQCDSYGDRGVLK
jgi:hypothetical protein